MALPYTALITVKDVERDAIKSLPIDFDNNASAVEKAITDITGTIETFLHRSLIVRRYTEDIVPTDWGLRPWLTDSYEAFVNDYPVVQIVKAEDMDGNVITEEYALHPESKKRYRLITGTEIKYVTITYYAGYMRDSSVDLKDLKAYSAEHAEIATLPPVLPDDIRSVTTELVLHRLTLASNQQLGMGQRVMGIAEQDVKMSPPDRYFIQDRLRELTTHRLLVI